MPVTPLTRRQFGLVTSAAVAALAAGPAHAAGGNWRPRASLPIKIQEIYPALLGDKIHVAGGFIAETDTISGATDRHFAYDPTTDQWAEKAPLPGMRHHPNLVPHRGRLFALGGFQPQAADAVWVMQNQTWTYNPSADRWREAAPAPQPHGETVCASLGDHLHVVGGRTPKGTSNKGWQDHTDTARHLVYDPSVNQWQEAAPALTARNSAAGAIINGQLYIAGGRTVADGNVAALEIYDPQEDKWRKAAPMPQAQGGLASAALGGKLYAFGGEFFNDGGGVYPECWVYDPQADQWAVIPSMPTPRHGLGAVALAGTIYVIAGAARVGGNETTGLVEAFTPA